MLLPDVGVCWCVPGGGRGGGRRDNDHSGWQAGTSSGERLTSKGKGSLQSFCHLSGCVLHAGWLMGGLCLQWHVGTGPGGRGGDDGCKSLGQGLCGKWLGRHTLARALCPSIKHTDLRVEGLTTSSRDARHRPHESSSRVFAGP